MGRKAPWPPKVYQRRGADYIRYYHDGDPKEEALGPTGSHQARENYLHRVAELEKGLYERANRQTTLTVKDAAAEFVRAANQEYPPTSQEPENLRLSLKPVWILFGSLPVADFGPDQLRIVQAAMADGSWMSESDKAEYRRRKIPIGWCRNVVNRRVVRVRTAWRWLEERRLAPPGSWVALKCVRCLKKTARNVRHTPKRKPTSREDLDLVLPHCSPPVAAMIELQWLAGMRSKEVRLMRGEEIEAGGEVWRYMPGTHKNDWREDAPARVVALGPQCQEIMRPWLRTSGYLFRTLASRVGKDGPKYTEAPYTTFSYAQAVRRACDKAGVKILPYQNRHAAKQRVTRAFGLDGARAYLGQKSLGTTNEYASQIDMDHASEIAKEMG